MFEDVFNLWIITRDGIGHRHVSLNDVDRSITFAKLQHRTEEFQMEIICGQV